MTTFSSDQLNFFKFSTVVFDEFPVALRKVFEFLWNNQSARPPGFQLWDDSSLVRNLFLNKEGGLRKLVRRKMSVPTSKSFMEWDCTDLFEATLYAESFAMPDGKGGRATLGKLYVKPCGVSPGTFHQCVFHHSVISPSGKQVETWALALDQLRLLRNSLCHQTSSQKIDKATFDNYIQLSKDAISALGQSTTKIDDVGKLGEKDFPTSRVQQLEEELRREKFKQIEDNQAQMDAEITNLGSDMKDGMADVRAKVQDVGSNVKELATGVTAANTKVKETRSEVKEVKNEGTGMKTKVEDIGSDVKGVQSGVTDVRSKVASLGSGMKNMQRDVTDVKTQLKNANESVVNIVKSRVAEIERNVIKDIRSDVKPVEVGMTDLKTNVQEIRSDTEDVKTGVADVRSRLINAGLDIKDVKSRVTDMNTKLQDVPSEMKEVNKNVADVNLKMEINNVIKDIRSDVKPVKVGMTDLKTNVQEIRSDTKDVKTGVADVRSRLINAGLDIKDVKLQDVPSEMKDVNKNVAGVKIEINNVKDQATEVRATVGEKRSDVKVIKPQLTSIDSKVTGVGSDVKDVENRVRHVKATLETLQTEVNDAKIRMAEFCSDVRTRMDFIAKLMPSGITKGKFY